MITETTNEKVSRWNAERELDTVTRHIECTLSALKNPDLGPAGYAMLRKRLDSLRASLNRIA